MIFGVIQEVEGPKKKPQSLGCLWRRKEKEEEGMATQEMHSFTYWQRVA